MTSKRTVSLTGERAISKIVPDASALKALAHPMRLQMLGMLRINGPATATQLARLLGLNSGATSYHLRQLAQHGFIEDAPGLSRRERWWRSRHELTSVPPVTAPGEDLGLAVAFTQAALLGQVQQMQQAVEEYASLPPTWRKASEASDVIIPLKPEEAEALTAQIMDLIITAMRRAPPLAEKLEDGRVPFSVMLHAFPHPGRAKT
jgi:DNA-binding transcriptional ArsR family regulator